MPLPMKYTMPPSGMHKETVEHVVFECEALKQEALLLSEEGETTDILRFILKLVKGLVVMVIQARVCNKPRVTNIYCEFKILPFQKKNVYFLIIKIKIIIFTQNMELILSLEALT